MTTEPTDRNAPVTTIYGASDDLIELEGGVGGEEYALDRKINGDDGVYLAFDNDVILTVAYGKDGIWRIAVIADGGSPELATVTPCPDPTGETDYTDRAVITGATKYGAGPTETAARRALANA